MLFSALWLVNSRVGGNGGGGQLLMFVVSSRTLEKEKKKRHLRPLNVKGDVWSDPGHLLYRLFTHTALAFFLKSSSDSRDQITLESSPLLSFNHALTSPAQ